MLVRLTHERRPRPVRWIARWMLAVTVCLTLAAEAAAPCVDTVPARQGTGALHADLQR